MSASNTERLLALALVLMNSTRPLTRSQLRESVGGYPSGGDPRAFERKFERDKEDLRSMGIPIESVPVDDDGGIGYRIAKDRVFLTPVEVTADERIALAIASRVWHEANWNHAGTTALRKLELLGGYDPADSPQYALTFPVDSQLVTELLRAIEARRTVSFNYRTSTATETAPRTVDPWAVVAANGHWYLVGFDRDRQARRTFRLSRVVDKIHLGRQIAAYDIPNAIDHQDLLLGSNDSSEQFVAQIRAKPGQAQRLRKRAKTLDGDLLHVEFGDVAAAKMELLELGDSVVVIEPLWLVEQVVAAWQRIADWEEPPGYDQKALARAITQGQKARVEPAGARLARLLALVPWLRAHPGITYEQAADQFGIDPKRLRADLELVVCTEFGATLTTIDIDMWGNSISVRDSQGIDAPLRFSSMEAYSLLVALQLLLQSMPVDQVEPIISISEKLRAVVGESALVGEHVRVIPPPTSTDQFVPEIRQALTEQRAVLISYLSSTDSLSERIVDPIGLLDTGRARYLQGWCRSAGAIRTFRLDRIESLSVTDLAIDLPVTRPDVPTTVEPTGEQVVLRVSPSARWWVDNISAAAVIDEEDGSVVVSLAAGSEEWLIRTVAGFGGEVSVLEPVSFRDALRRRATDTLALYAV